MLARIFHRRSADFFCAARPSATIGRLRKHASHTGGLGGTKCGEDIAGSNGPPMTAVARRCFSLLTALVCATAVGSVKADSISDFYKANPINLYVGAAPGGGYDMFARLLARHLGRHIPGSPSV